MQNFLILIFLFLIFYLVDSLTDAAASSANDNSKVVPPGVNAYMAARLEIMTWFTGHDDAVQVQALAYRISWYFWWWCLRICPYYYWSNGNWWIVYDIYYWYPCWRLGWPWWPWWTLAATQVTPVAICGDFQGFFNKALRAETKYVNTAQFTCGDQTRPLKREGGSAPHSSDNDPTANLPEKAIVFEVTTRYNLMDDIRKVHALTYFIIRPYWWWCFRICIYHYWNGFFWVARYTIIYRYPCWPWFYPVNLVRVPTDPGIIGPIRSYDDQFDRYDLVAFAKEALNADPVNIRNVCLIIGDQIYEYAPVCYKKDPTC